MRGLRVSLLAAFLFAAPRVALSEETPAKGDLVVALAAEPTTLDPVKYAAGVDTYVLTDLFEQPLKPDPSGKTQNWLAESWSMGGTPDKRILDVHIRPGVTFHNGDPLTAADYEFSYQRLRDPAQSRWSHRQALIESFEIIDSLHFRLHFREPDAGYVADELQLWAMPKRYFEQVGAEGFAKHPVGTGPWRFVSWQIKDEMRLEAYDNYWNKEHRPGVKNLTIKFIPEDLTRVAAYKTGAVDWIDAVPPAMVQEFRSLPNTATFSAVDGNNLFIELPQDLPKSPFNDVRVRQAAAYAIDMDAIISKVLFGQGKRYAELGEGEPGYDPALKPYPFDQRKARELLRAAGYPNGFDTSCYNLTTPREPNMKEMGEAVFAYLSAAGIRCRIVQMEYGAWITHGRRGRPGQPLDGPTSWMWGHGVPGDAGTPWSGHLHSYEPGKGWGDSSHTSDSQADTLLEQARRALDPAHRADLLRQIAFRKHAEVLGGITTYQPLVTFAWRADTVKFQPWPWPGFWRSFQELGRKQ